VYVFKIKYNTKIQSRAMEKDKANANRDRDQKAQVGMDRPHPKKTWG